MNTFILSAQLAEQGSEALAGPSDLQKLVLCQETISKPDLAPEEAVLVLAKVKQLLLKFLTESTDVKALKS